MNQKKDYIVSHDFKSPYVMSTGIPHKPTKIEFRVFKRGQIVSGVLIMASGRPAYVLSNGTFVLPLSNIKEMTTKSVSHGFDGTGADGKLKTSAPPIKPITNPKVKYLDGILIGTAVGVIVSFIGVKRGWFTAPEGQKWMPYAIGGGVGAALAAYVVYRKNNKQEKKKTEEKK